MATPAQVALVTGGNRGLGFEVCRRLGQAGMRVLLAAREAQLGSDAARALRAVRLDVTPVTLDVTDRASIDALARQLDRDRVRLDALVNNAGVYQGEPHDILEVNFTGTLEVTERLLPRLAAGARVVMVTSGLGSLAGLPPALRAQLDPPPPIADLRMLVAEAAAGRHPDVSAYGFSKAALNALTRRLAAELAPRHIRVVSVCPGWVRTRMGGGGAPRSVEEGADTIAWAALPDAGTPTGVVLRDRQVVPF